MFKIRLDVVRYMVKWDILLAGGWLDKMVLEVFSKLSDSMILHYAVTIGKTKTWYSGSVIWKNLSAGGAQAFKPKHWL